MRLIDDWRRTVMRSYAVWAGVLAGVFGVAAGAIPVLLVGTYDGRVLLAAAMVCAGLSGLLGIVGTPIGRVKRQKSLSGDQ